MAQLQGQAPLQQEQDLQQLVSKEDLSEPLQDLPPVEFAFAYGSGVFHQDQASDERMVDYIFGVSSAADWHSQNIKMNPKHYSSLLSVFGGKTIANTARVIGAGVHFNPFVRWQDKVMKYGVIGIPDLVEDIETWKRLYISGRLQKPVCILADESGIVKANEVNLRAALSAALLLLPYEFTEDQLYASICGLSYQGDIRTLFAEDKAKVSKIVQGSLPNFRSLYSGTVDEAASKDMLKQSPEGFYKQDIGTKAIRSHVSRLPSTLLQCLASKTGITYEGSSTSVAVADALVRQGLIERPRLVKEALSSIVRRSSFRQAVSGFIAVGGVNAVRYTSRKIAKAWQSRK